MRSNTVNSVHLQYQDPLVRAGIASLICRQDDMCLRVAHGAAQNPAGMGCRDRVPPGAVVISDSESAPALLARTKARQAPGFSVLIVSARSSELEIRRALAAGARGYLVLGCSCEELVEAVRSAYHGGCALSGLAS